MRRVLVMTVMLLAANAAIVTAAQVDCDRGNSINDALRRLAAQTVAGPATLWVRGTCTEYVQIRGFDGLTLNGRPGATLVKPSTPADSVLVAGVLTIDASRSVTVDGLAVQGGDIGIRGGSSDIRVWNTTVDSGGINIFEHSQVSLAGVEVHPSFAALQVYDMSDVHLEDSLFENAAGGYGFGVLVTKALVTMHGTVIRNFGTGMNVIAGGVLDVSDFGTFVPTGGPTEVLIENPTSTGCSVSGGTVNLAGGAKLRITNSAGNGVYVGNAGRVTGTPLEVTGSANQGVLVTNNSVVSLYAAKITGNGHGGLVVVNQSTAEAGGTLSGNGTDVFCDSRSLVTGGARIVGATTILCTNLLPGSYEELP